MRLNHEMFQQSRWIFYSRVFYLVVLCRWKIKSYFFYYCWVLLISYLPHRLFLYFYFIFLAPERLMNYSSSSSIIISSHPQKLRHPPSSSPSDSSYSSHSWAMWSADSSSSSTIVRIGHWHSWIRHSWSMMWILVDYSWMFICTEHLYTWSWSISTFSGIYDI